MAQIPRLTFPAGYNPADNVCLKVPRALIPALGALLAQWLWRASWAEGDHEQGYQAALLLMERLLQECDVSCECDELLIPETGYFRPSIVGTGQLYYANGALRWQPASSAAREVLTSSGSGWSPITPDPGFSWALSYREKPGYKLLDNMCFLRGYLEASVTNDRVLRVPTAAIPSYQVNRTVSTIKSNGTWQPARLVISSGDGSVYVYGTESGDAVWIDAWYEV